MSHKNIAAYISVYGGMDVHINCLFVSNIVALKRASMSVNGFMTRCVMNVATSVAADVVHGRAR